MSEAPLSPEDEKIITLARATRARTGSSEGAAATVGELLLEAEGTTGRRNRIDTVLVTRQREDPEARASRDERQTADA